MTTPEKIEFIRSKAIEANPSIKDLVFGCEVKVTNDIGYYIGEFLNANYVQFPKYSVPQCLNKKDIEIQEIIGRQIRLADVLLAINNRGEQFITCLISSTGHFYQRSALPLVTATAETWDLKNDDLTKQSSDTVDFIYSLLK